MDHLGVAVPNSNLCFRFKKYTFPKTFLIKIGTLVRTYLCTSVQPYKSFQITSKNEKYYRLKIKNSEKKLRS